MSAETDRRFTMHILSLFFVKRVFFLIMCVRAFGIERYCSLCLCSGSSMKTTSARSKIVARQNQRFFHQILQSLAMTALLAVNIGL